MDPGQSLVAIPGAEPAQDASSKKNISKKDEELKESLADLPFSVRPRTSYHGLPMRLCWELWAVVYSWKCDMADSVEATIELGEDGHHHSLNCKTLGQPEFKLMEAYHPRSDKLRVSLTSAADGKLVGYCYFRLKDLTPLKPCVGWVKVKGEERDAKSGKRQVVGSVQFGLRLSEPQKAPVLFLLDMRERESLFFQEVLTLQDLNPVFSTPSMTPFKWQPEAATGLWQVSNSQKVVVASLQMRPAKSLVDIVRLDQEEYWQCSITHDDMLGFRVDGSWTGVVKQRDIRDLYRRTEFTVTSGDGICARAEWRNARDVKLSVDDANVDPLTMILVLISVYEMLAWTKQGPSKK